MGGAIREKAYSNKKHTLDLKRGVWYELEGTLPAGRCGRMNGILVGDKVYYWKVIWERITGNDNLEYIDVENMESQTTEDLDEMGAYKEINESFGVSVVRLIYKPENTVLVRYTLDKEQKRAYLFYEYNGELLKYSIYMNDADSSFGQKELDKLSDKYHIDNSGVKISIEEFNVDQSENKRYIAEFEYRNIHYQLKGVIPRSEFDKILKNLIFL